MGTEIERKYLVKSMKDVDLKEVKKSLIRQGYLSIDETNLIQARFSVKMDEKKGYLNVKGIRKDFCERPEYESDVPFNVAMKIISKCDRQIIKTRHYYEKDIYGHEWVIDELHGANEGLIIAELEFDNNENFDISTLPRFCYHEVTDDESFYNYFLAQISIHNPIGRIYRAAREDFIKSNPHLFEICKDEFELFDKFFDKVLLDRDAATIDLMARTLK